MVEIKGKFLESINRTKAVKSFRFVPDKKINFQAGQFAQVIFDEANRGNKSLNKYLSFSCSPEKGYIEVTKRISDSEFSHQLQKLKQGESVLFKAPMGNCIYDERYKKIAFLAGGIGITPVISIIEYIIMNKLSVDVCLFYANRTEEDIAFKDELENWQQNNNILRVTYSVDEGIPTDKHYVRGFLNKDILLSKIPDWNERFIFVFGPPSMVTAMENICIGIACNKEMIKTESFIGYA
ncbi:MAG: FAD-dependent oxidoreductase [Candidatus Omnitrophica bacterium]|nr:FAD-dependent oxidoreductase [Candidatus Omnitrophota bacterium]